MKSYRNSQSAPYGLYVSKSPVDMTFVSADGEPIDGKAGASYVRVPTLLAVVLSPAIGGVFVLAFPLVVLAAVAYGIAQFAARPVRKLAERHANLARVRWEPATAYLDGGQSEEAAEGETSEELAELEEEVQARRESEKSDPELDL